VPLAGRRPAEGARPGADARPLTVGELNRRARLLLERELPEVWVEGALSKVTRAASGHLYFGLQDTTSRVDAIMWGASVRTLPFAPAEGLQVRVVGKVTLYEPNGRYQVVVSRMEPAGLGAREALLRALRAKLAAEGVLDPSRKRPVPFLPRRIALVTSPDGAAVHDLVRVILGRFPRARILLVPARVQGDGAALEVADGIRRASVQPGVDVVIAGRGGGSVEDLWAFNEEAVARAIFASPVPVVSAVGHEVDTTLADEVADVRAATPSHAGQLVVPVLADLLGAVSGAIERGRWAVVRQVRAEARLVRQAREKLARVLSGRASAARQRVEAAGRVLDAQSPAAHVRRLRQRMDDAGRRLALAIGLRLAAAHERLEARLGRLAALNPTAVLARGFSLTWVETAAGRELIRDGGRLAAGAVIRTTFATGPDAVSEVVRKAGRGVEPGPGKARNAAAPR
jgi:exodeoxyribonuclease VII large subunit